METAADFNRFEVKCQRGRMETLVVTEERDINSSVALNNLDDNSIRIFMNSAVTSPK